MRERKLQRLQNYDYSKAGMYFITINVKDRVSLFGRINNGSVELNEMGQIAFRCWQEIPDHFSAANIDEFIIMPDHVHGIVEIIPVGNGYSPVGNADLRSLRWDRTKMTIPKIIHGYKSSVTRTINMECNTNFTWQKSFHDRIIRNEKELCSIRQYIKNNPVIAAIL